jgi:hypothetical protein
MYCANGLLPFPRMHLFSLGPFVSTPTPSSTTNADEEIVDALTKVKLWSVIESSRGFGLRLDRPTPPSLKGSNSFLTLREQCYGFDPGRGNQQRRCGNGQAYAGDHSGGTLSSIPSSLLPLGPRLNTIMDADLNSCLGRRQAH